MEHHIALSPIKQMLNSIPIHSRLKKCKPKKRYRQPEYKRKMLRTVDHKLCFSADLTNCIVCIAYINSFVSWNHVFDDQTFIIVFNNGSVIRWSFCFVLNYAAKKGRLKYMNFVNFHKLQWNPRWSQKKCPNQWISSIIVNKQHDRIIKIPSNRHAAIIFAP